VGIEVGVGEADLAGGFGKVCWALVSDDPTSQISVTEVVNSANTLFLEYM
jgi:hypothetical protein